MSLTIRERIRRVHAERCGDSRHRYRSWEHCYAFFQAATNRRTDDEAVERASLQLGFYLASWGMYRGSSFLLQKDYLVHKPAICSLFAPKHGMLWSCEDRILAGDEEVAVQVFRLAGEIKVAYITEFRNSHTGRKDKGFEAISNTLVTKVLLGTMGCCPAYDTYFVRGATGIIQPARFGVESLKKIIAFVRAKGVELLDLQNELAAGEAGVRYPLMRLVDMGFWQKGFEEACIDEIQDAIHDDKKKPLLKPTKDEALAAVAHAKDDIDEGQLVLAARRVAALGDDVRPLIEKTAAYRYFSSLLRR